jgi:hypothetical protein|mmetsp:Transcript_71247/g.112852  ORF Transcript_71247/g.112852 Transcript_71247/m.112852 type:complete len:353 (+) Transcript_71247:74-1132(+)|eukprot:CAMPEP_0169109546 /NCGR_PEP_ID=MMETSP1015-20121227/26022_1 /TAXON_ID=342587 /ORGANISM="Karlodinium micrum, Strain CCMP2283" /LENGTH=352 /DNA_ID=CAMNT_0009171249 /DNA_START=72 /DNA_END=1130 /DNA_ORIENTATION=-
MTTAGLPAPLALSRTGVSSLTGFTLAPHVGYRAAGATLPTSLSYVPPVASELAQPPMAPARLTEGIPDPTSIEAQKTKYAKDLDDQLQRGAAILNQQLKQQMDQLHKLADEQKKQYFVQVDHEIKSQELGLVQQFKEQLLLVQQAASQQKKTLGQQATALMLEYHQKKAREDFLMEEYRLNKAAFDAQMMFSQESHQLQQQQIAASQAAMQQQQVVEMHAAQAMAAIEEQRMQVAQQMTAQSKLVQAAGATAATATAMYSTATTPSPPSYVPPVQYASTVPATTYSYTPAPVTGNITPLPPARTMSYSPAPVTQMPTLSYTPPVLAGAVTVAPPTQVVTPMINAPLGTSRVY